MLSYMDPQLTISYIHEYVIQRNDSLATDYVNGRIRWEQVFMHLQDYFYLFIYSLRHVSLYFVLL